MESLELEFAMMFNSYVAKVKKALLWNRKYTVRRRLPKI
jgi:hypothetical protein